MAGMMREALDSTTSIHRSVPTSQRKGTTMLSKEILEAQATVELPAREMMDFANFGNFAVNFIGQSNFADQSANGGGSNTALQVNSACLINYQQIGG